MQKNILMKFKYIPYVFAIILTLTMSSCKDKLFDFNLQNIEADGEWGLPVYNGTLSVGDLLGNLDSLNHIHFNNDGVLTFVFENEVKNIVSLGNLFRINNQQIDTSGNVVVTQLPNLDVTQVIQFNLNTPEFHLTQAVIKAGQLNVYFNLNNANFTYNTELVSGNIRDAQGDSVRLHFHNTLQTQSFNLSNYTIQPNEDGTILFNAHVIIPSATAVEQFQYICHVELLDFTIYSAIGKIQPLSHQYQANTPFKFKLDDILFNDIQLNNARTSIYCQNSICRIDGQINDFKLFGQNGSMIQLVTSPLAFSAPISPNQYVYINDINIPHLSYNPEIDSLGVQCDFTVNPEGFAAGNISVDENSSLNLKLRTELPANISIDNAVYTDTIDNSLYGQLNDNIMQTIETLTLRIAYTNALPFDLIPSIVFWNSSTGEKYELNLNNLQIHGAYSGVPYQQSPVYIDIHNSDTQKIADADKIILNFRLQTMGQNVTIMSSQFIHTSIGAKIKYSHINM